MAQTKNIKKRNWTFILYPESAPEDWKEQLKLLGVMTAVSPIHNKDINPTGEVKKEHYHIILAFNNPTTYQNVLRITEEFNATIPKPIESVVGMYRYLTHKDNPEKAQYNEEDILLFNGFDPVTLLTETETFNLLKNLIIIIREENILQFEDLIFYILENDFADLYPICIKYTYFLQTLLASRRCKLEIAKKLSCKK